MTHAPRAARSAVLLELTQFASLLIAILSLHAVLHAAFLEPGRNLEQQFWPALRMLLLAAVACLGSGFVFRIAHHGTGTLFRSLPMLLFWWAGGVMVTLFAVSWFVERYFLRLWS
jgi:hypothetical protein